MQKKNNNPDFCIFGFLWELSVAFDSRPYTVIVINPRLFYLWKSSKYHSVRSIYINVEVVYYQQNVVCMSSVVIMQDGHFQCVMLLQCCS